MNPLEPTQELLLDYLYGLLGDAEKRQVEEMLRTSEDWRRAYEEARFAKQVFADAARARFPEVRFEPPAPKTQPHLAAPTREQAVVVRRRSWARWAMAAGILLACFGVGAGAGFVTLYGHYAELRDQQDRYTQLESKRHDLESRYGEAQRQTQEEIRKLQEQIKEIEEKWQGDLKKVDKEISEQQLQVIITGPQTIQAGARNEYQIETRRPGRPPAPEPAPAKVEAKVIDPDSNKVLFEQTLDNATGRSILLLPRDLPVTPGKQLKLQVAALGEGGVKALVSEQLPLVGRLYLTHLTTDRPMYRPGEVVHFRSLTLDRFSLKPPEEPFRLTFTVFGPLGNKVWETTGTTHLTDSKEDRSLLLKGPDGQPIRGIGAGSFQIPTHLAGGEYTLEVREADNKFPPERRKFLVNKYQAPRLNKELEFHRKSYGPGDIFEIRAKVSRVEGGQPVAHRPVAAEAFVDGRSIGSHNTQTNERGEVPPLSFTLPKEIRTGQGTVSLKFTDGANVETLVRPIPIVLNRLVVHFYPEGGDLVAGAPNRVYFEVRTPDGKPAELKGHVVDGGGTKIVAIQTLNDDVEPGVNQGMGVFQFTPESGKSYRLKVDSPIGIKEQFPLPVPKANGVVLSIPQGVVAGKIDAYVHSVGQDRNLLVGAYCRGRLIAHTKVVAKANDKQLVALPLAEPVGGVYRVTVFEERSEANGNIHLLPLAERLVWRKPLEKLDLNIVTDKKRYTPGDRVTVKIQSTDEKNRPAPAIALVRAVDDSILKLADEKTARTMPTHYFLSTEIKNPEDLEYADFLISDHPKAEAALDLLLGTQGWRRFAEQDPQLFLKRQQPKDRPDAQRLLLVNGLAQPKARDLTRTAREKVDSAYAPKWQEEQAEVAKVEDKLLKSRQEYASQVQRVEDELNTVRSAKAAAQEALNQHVSFLAQIGLGLLAAFLLVGGMVVAAIGIARTSSEQRGGSLALIIGAAACFLALLLGGGGLLLMLGGDRFGQEHPAIMVKRDMAGAMAQEAAPPMADDGPRLANADDKRKMAAPPKQADGGVERLDDPQRAVAKKFDRPDDARLMLPPARPMGPLAQDRLAPPQPVPGGPAAPIAPRFPGAGIALPGEEGLDNFPGRANFGGRRDWPGDNPQEMFWRQKGNFQMLARYRLRRQDQIAGITPPKIPFYVREYAHRYQPAEDGVRRDFAETIYWHPVLVLPGGEAEVSFDLSDSVTTFRVEVWAHGLDGRLGAGKADVISRLPFSVEPKVPVEVNNNDKITIPVAVANDTDSHRTVNVKVAATNLTVVGEAEKAFDIAPNQRVRKLFTFLPSTALGEAKLLVSGRSQPFGADSVERTFQVVPEGFPHSGAASDLLEGTATHQIILPETWVKGSLKLQAQVFPSTLADLQKGLESLLREPHGCFEQTSSSNYPNVMILSYLKEADKADPAVEKRARQLLESGYGKLVSFECRDPQDASKRGYEWFGGTAPPHEALTAYGLLQFKDMARFQTVDEKMLQRTEKYLLDQRDGNGGFKRNARALDSFGRAPPHITNAYIVWALTEYGTKEDLSKELDALQKKAEGSKDPYFLSLVSLGLLNAGKSKEALELLKKVRDQQKEDGHLVGTDTSITSSRGRELEIETTSLAVLAWLKANRPAEFTQPVRKAAEWIGKQRGGYGGFGSTQSTILALKALIAYTRDNRKTADAGELSLFVNGKKVDQIVFPAGYEKELIVSVPREDLLRPGKNDVRIEMTGKNQFPYTLSWSYNTLKPANADQSPVHLTTQLDRAAAKEGETVRLTATVENKSGQGQGMAVAILGLPAGLSLPEDMKQLKDMARLRDDGKKPGLIGAWEVRGRELVLYWRDLAPDQKIEVTLDLICCIPGEYRGPASRAYLYYQSDRKHWTDPLSVRITPAGD